MLDASRLLDQNDHADDTQPRRSGSPRRHETAFVPRTSKLHWTAPTARSARRSSSSTRRTPSVRPCASCAGVRSAAGPSAWSPRQITAPHARFRLCQPTARFAGSPEEIAAQSRQQQELLWKLYAPLARRSGRPAEEISEDMRRGRRLGASEAFD